MRCSSYLCSDEAVFHIWKIAKNRAIGIGENLCERHANPVWESHVNDHRIPYTSTPDIEGFRRFELELIMHQPDNPLNRVLLRAVSTDAVLFIPMAYLELCNLYYSVQESPYRQLMVQMIMVNAIRKFGGEISYVMIDELRTDEHLNTYFMAKPVFIRGNDVLAVEMRASDALAMAIVANVPFLVAETVLAQIKKTGKFGRVG
jgi:bifunctional DNase/RNase